MPCVNNFGVTYVSDMPKNSLNWEFGKVVYVVWYIVIGGMCLEYLQATSCLGFLLLLLCFA